MSQYAVRVFSKKGNPKVIENLDINFDIFDMSLKTNDIWVIVEAKNKTEAEQKAIALYHSSVR